MPLDASRVSTIAQLGDGRHEVINHPTRLNRDRRAVDGGKQIRRTRVTVTGLPEGARIDEIAPPSLEPHDITFAEHEELVRRRARIQRVS